MTRNDRERVEKMKKELEYCKILETNINVTNMEDTIAYITEHLDQLKGDYICVSNVHTTVMAYRDKDYRRVQNSAAMALPDGQPLSIVSRKRGFSQAKRVPGPDLMPAILDLSQKTGYRHYFYGSTEATLAALETALRRRYPKLQIVGMYSPPFREMTEQEDEEVIRRINESGADFVWVALGAPKQEWWMHEHRNKINALMLGVGAAFDFTAGTTKRSPMWMQKLCLEWVFRILQDPKRMLPRYLNTNFAFLYYVYKEGRAISRTARKGMRIAMIGHKRIPSREGGVEVVVDELSVRMAAKGHWVDAYNRYGHHVSGKKYDQEYGWKGRKYYKGIRVYIVPTFRRSSLNAIVYTFFATIMALFHNYDVIHYHAEGPCAMLWLPHFLKRKIVVTIHGLDWQRAKWGNIASYVIKFGERMAARYADEIIVLSDNVRQYFMDTYHRQVTYIPNGISRPEMQGSSLIEEKFGLAKGGYFLFLARIVPEKGLHYLIKAFYELDTDKKLVIAGGSSQAMAYMEQIHQMAAKDERILMTDFVQGQVLEELYANAYAFVLPSDVEGMAMTLLEAMSYGTCCLVSDIRENTEVVEDRAFTFHKGNVQDLRKQLAYLLEHPEEVRQKGAESADFICGKYDWDDVTEQTLALYERAAKRRGTEKGE